MNLLIAILTAYVVTKTITAGHILLPARKLFRRIMWPIPIIGDHFTLTYKKKLVLEDPSDWKEEHAEPTGYDAASCALCVGLYVSMTVGYLLDIEPRWWGGIWGGMYAIVTQERG